MRPSRPSTARSGLSDRRVRVAAVILAAGAGRRAGGPKAFLTLRDDATGRDEAFLTVVARVAREGGCSPILAVVRPKDRALAAVAAPGLALAVNPAPERGMLSSLRSGVDALPAMEGILAFPVDHPHVRPATVRALLAAFAADPTAVVKPSLDGRGGHPTVLPFALAESLPAGDVEGGLAAALLAAGARVVRVAVDDAGVRINVNDPEAI